jgi:hypothetical protein
MAVHLYVVELDDVGVINTLILPPDTSTPYDATSDPITTTPNSVEFANVSDAMTKICVVWKFVPCLA